MSSLFGVCGLGLMVKGLILAGFGIQFEGWLGFWRLRLHPRAMRLRGLVHTDSGGYPHPHALPQKRPIHASRKKRGQA